MTVKQHIRLAIERKSHIYMLDMVEWDRMIQSTNVSRMAYDTDRELLYIQFKTGAVYRYSVGLEEFYAIGFGDAATRTAGEWGAVGKSPSMGAAVWQYLIDQGVPYVRVAWFPTNVISEISPTLDPSRLRDLIENR